MTDIEIARNITPKPINDILETYGFTKDSIYNYGPYMAKITKDNPTNQEGDLILVTSINPTPYGEGKTTISIGLCDGLNALGKKAIAVLREPSLGPVFGLKGGATGGGHSQIIPMEDINLHFTGDIHAITCANNLLCAIIDNHIFQGNALNIKKVTFTRCLDINDRALRNITINSSYEREDHFQISVASPIMAVLCLSKDFEDLKNRLSKMIVGFNDLDKPIYVQDLDATDALAIILKDAINPNAVQTLEGNLALVHGGPFANIAHGCSSLTSIKMALKHAPYVVTEAGFGADLGAEKFLDITVQEGNLDVSLIVLNVTIRSLKHHGWVKKENLPNLDLDSLKQGLSNLECHISNLKQYTSNILVVINKFNTDYEEEINLVKSFVQSKALEFVVNNSYLEGSKGSLDFAKKVVTLCHKEKIKRLYDVNASIPTKIEHLAKNIYHANSVKYTNKALEEIKLLEKLNLDKIPICVAKTPMSISDNKELLGYPKDYQINVTDIKISNGAGFIIVYMGNILTMPGLNKNAAYLNMKIDKNKKIEGLF